MRKVAKICSQILGDANRDLLTAKEKQEKIRFAEYIFEVKILEQIIEISNAIANEMQTNKNCELVAPLLKITSDNITRMLHLVATKRSLQKAIIDEFKNSNALINTKF